MMPCILKYLLLLSSDTKIYIQVTSCAPSIIPGEDKNCPGYESLSVGEMDAAKREL